MTTPPEPDTSNAVAVELIAVLVAAANGAPLVMTIQEGAALPSGPFEHGHRSLQRGLRAWVEGQTGRAPGFLEQLYTFADRDRTGSETSMRAISISYLGLTREEQVQSPSAGWRSWYDYFPWEDHRDGAPTLIADLIIPKLRNWSESEAIAALREDRWRRAAIAFGLDGAEWNEEFALQRYELLYEAGLVPEALRNRRAPHEAPIPGRAMAGDHRRILATGVARLRAKIKYRPVVFELMPPSFTLLQLQRAVEALAGRRLHKQNFRRLIEQQELVEETGETLPDTGGRPAKLFRFRHAVVAERAVAGAKLPLSRT